MILLIFMKNVNNDPSSTVAMVNEVVFSCTLPFEMNGCRKPLFAQNIASSAVDDLKA